MTTAQTGYETQLWQMADALRGKKMARLVGEWSDQQAEARRLDAEIEANLPRLGFGYNEPV